jgi:uroporphyrin-III C-methyltransferase
MGVRSAGTIQTGLLQGLPADTPLAIIEHVSLPQQRHAISQLGHLVDTLQTQQLGSPSVIVLGDVLKGLAALAQRPAQPLPLSVRA